MCLYSDALCFPLLPQLRGPCEYVHIVGDVIARHAAAALTPLSRTAVIIAQAGSSCPPFLPPSPAVTLAHTPAWSVACVGPMCGSIGPLVLAGPPPPPPLVQADPPPLPSCEPLSSRIRTLHAQLEGAQRPSDCSTARLLVFDYGSEAALHGFSAMFQFLASSLLVARASGRVLVEISSAGAEQDVWPRAPLGPCAGKLLACYFEPLSSCEFVSQAPGHLASLPFLQWGNMAEVGLSCVCVCVCAFLTRMHSLCAVCFPECVCVVMIACAFTMKW